MRLTDLSLLAPLLATTLACSDPRCHPDEVKVGITCRPLRTEADASAASSEGDESADQASPDGGKPRGDAARPNDALPTPGAAPGSPTALDAILDALPGGPPSFQFRADTVTLRGSSVASIPNRRGSDALLVMAGALEGPSADAQFAGAPVLLFNGTQWLDSSLPASAWKFLHDGTGFELFHVYAPTALNTLQVPGGTSGGGANQRGLYLVQNTNGSVRHTVYGASGEVCGALSTEAGQSADVPSYVDFYYKENHPVECAAFAGANVGEGGDSSALPDAVQEPLATFRLGARVSDGTGAMKMRWSETLIFRRALHEYERQLVREYIEARYGIAAPTLSGADRDIMSLLPFSWMDAANYVTSAGKVTSFVDRARPGHRFAQATPAHQVATPSASADFGGALTASLSDSFYLSTLPAIAWAFTADGSGFDSFMPIVSTDMSFSRVAWRTTTSPTAQGANAFVQTSGFYRLQLLTETGAAFSNGVNGVSLNQPTLLRSKHGSSLRPNVLVRVTGAAAASFNYTAQVGSGATQSPMGLWGNNETTSTWSGKCPAALFFDRVLSTAEEAKCLAALHAKYGVAP